MAFRNPPIRCDTCHKVTSVTRYLDPVNGREYCSYCHVVQDGEPHQHDPWTNRENCARCNPWKAMAWDIRIPEDDYHRETCAAKPPRDQLCRCLTPDPYLDATQRPIWMGQPPRECSHCHMIDCVPRYTCFGRDHCSWCHNFLQPAYFHVDPKRRSVGDCMQCHPGRALEADLPGLKQDDFHQWTCPAKPPSYKMCSCRNLSVDHD